MVLLDKCCALSQPPSSATQHLIKHLTKHTNINNINILQYTAKLCKPTVKHHEDLLLLLLQCYNGQTDNLAIDVPVEYTRLKAKLAKQRLDTPDLSDEDITAHTKLAEQSRQQLQTLPAKLSEATVKPTPLFGSHLTAPETNLARPRRMVIKRTPYDPTAKFAKQPLTGSGFACPMCDHMCDYMCDTCESCGSRVKYMAGVGAVLCVDREAILAKAKKN